MSSMKVQGGYSQRRFEYKKLIFILERASDGAGWYCDMAYTKNGHHPVETEYWTSGDTHYWRLRDIMQGMKKEIDDNKFTIDYDRTYRPPSEIKDN